MQILNNTITNCDQDAIRIMNWKEPIIKGNTILIDGDEYFIRYSKEYNEYKKNTEKISECYYYVVICEILLSYQVYS